MFQNFINDAVKAARVARMAKSDQLSLGEIIKRFEPILLNMSDNTRRFNDFPTVVYDFEYLHPTSIDSWRGSYDELALNFVSDGPQMPIDKFVAMLKGCIGKTFTGYKGGEYVMSEDTPVWVANYGNAGNTAIIDVVDRNYLVMLITAYRGDE